MCSTRVPENRELVRTLVAEVWNRGNYDLVPDLVHPEFVLREAPGPRETRGVDGFLERAERFHGAFPDLELTIEDLLADGDRVALRWTARGTHRGELFGIPPTGSAVTLPGVTTYRIENATVRESWEFFDGQELQRQLGLAFPGMILRLPRLLWRKFRGGF